MVPTNSQECSPKSNCESIGWAVIRTAGWLGDRAIRQAVKDTDEWFDQTVQDTGDVLTGNSKAQDNDPDPVLPSPESKAFDSLTNRNPILVGDCFEFGEVGVDALSIDSTNSADSWTIEDLQGLIAGGGYDSIDPMNESLIDSMNSIFEVAEIPMF